MIALYGEHMEREVFDNRRATLQNLFKDAALQLLTLGMPVIFDFGFWTKLDRDDFISWAQNNDIDSEVHYLVVSYETCKHRAINRNSDLAGKSYEMTPEMLELFWSWFEVPSLDESVVWVQQINNIR